MATDEAYYEAEKKIEQALKLDVMEFYLIRVFALQIGSDMKKYGGNNG
jgi:hypothetical protein